MNVMKISDLPMPSSEFNRKLEKSAVRAEFQKQDWEKNFKNTMSFREYRLRLKLTVLTRQGTMQPEEAWKEIERFKKNEDERQNGRGRSVD